ncbi:MAG: polysaccharide deacetylase family protein [Clostridiales bacterium]|nr:polysaccharide deacetylase family protein [Clostridiales bacterium]
MEKFKKIVAVFAALVIMISFVSPSRASTRGGFIDLVYTSLLHREATEDERTYLLDVMRHGRYHAAEVIDHVVNCAEFYNTVTSDAEYASRLLSLIGGDLQKLDLYTYLMDRGDTREHIMYLFMQSEEYEELCERYNVGLGNTNERRHIDPNLPMIALTFDDGPSGETWRILDVLEEYDQAATFFVVGTNAENYQETIARAYSIGCEIGNHTYGHADLTSLDEAGIIDTIRHANRYIVSATGQPATVIRPPYGSYNTFVQDHVTRPLIHWDVDTRDWDTRNAVSTYNAIIDTAQDGDIVLMHDIYSSTADAACKAIARLVHDGYQLVTVSELARYRGGMTDGGIYFRFRPLEPGI